MAVGIREVWCLVRGSTLLLLRRLLLLLLLLLLGRLLRLKWDCWANGLLRRHVQLRLLLLLLLLLVLRYLRPLELGHRYKRRDTS